ncbi:DUF6929 family protein [Pontibacter vulgaris]|uniref:DUF6929 family protein n=1 Tax=Pontibacter vulgaris TaxID=2905679 RepID=UPI001FA7DBAE|nr:hypothetical protein [Pontibacter vulgaris]
MPAKLTFYLILLSSLLYTSCHTSDVSSNSRSTMKATIVKKVFYADIPSASGLEMVGDHYYINGDDSPFLYQLDSKYKLVRRLAMFDTSSFVSGRIPKPVKPDLESMAALKYKGNDYLVALGSGSAKPRNKAYILPLPAVSDNALQVKEVKLDELYYPLQQNKQVVGEDVLNIEGMAFSNYKVYLMHRALGAGLNVLIVYNIDEFASFLIEGAAVPTPAFYFFTLPKLQQYQAGFSGAYVFDQKLFFSSSIESAPNAIVDGEVLGSYVGYIPLKSLSDATDPASPAIINAALITQTDGNVFKGKAESLVVKSFSDKSKYKIVVVTDDDQGHSELLEIDFTVE